MINGSLTGMVCICAGADRYYPWAASIVAGMYVRVSLLYNIFYCKCKVSKISKLKFL